MYSGYDEGVFRWLDQKMIKVFKMENPINCLLRDELPKTLPEFYEATLSLLLPISAIRGNEDQVCGSRCRANLP